MRLTNDWAVYYNTQKPHELLGYMNPIQTGDAKMHLQFTAEVVGGCTSSMG